MAEAVHADFYRAQNLLPASEFAHIHKLLLGAADVPSVRVNGETGSGKSSVVRLLLNESLKQGKVRLRLHDPQSGSPEDRWGFPPSTTSTQAAVAAMQCLRQRVESKDAPPIATIDIFDEVDSSVRQDSKMKEAYLSVLTQVRHLPNQQLIAIGQNPKVKGVGLEWSDIDGVGSLYVGDCAIHAIVNSPKLKARSKVLEPQYLAIQEFCQKRNEAQGLDGSEANAFRFALVAVPRKAPFWAELPPFSIGVEPIANLVKGDVSVRSAHVCPHCGSSELRFNRQGKTSQQFRCKSCGKYHSK